MENKIKNIEEVKDRVDKEFFEEVTCPKCNSQRTEKYNNKHMCNVCEVVF